MPAAVRSLSIRRTATHVPSIALSAWIYCSAYAATGDLPAVCRSKNLRRKCAQQAASTTSPPLYSPLNPA